MLLSFLPIHVVGQDFKKDIVKLNQSFSKLEATLLKTVYSVYVDGSKTPHESREAVLLKNKDNMFYSDKNIEFMVNDKYIVYVDRLAKFIEINPRVDKLADKDNYDKLTQDLLLKIADEYKIVRYQELIVNKASYYISYAAGKFDLINFVFDKSTFLIEEVNYSFRKKIKLNNLNGEHNIKAKVNYLRSKIGEKEMSEYFSETNYVSIDDKKISLASKYKNYKIKNEIGTY